MLVQHRLESLVDRRQIRHRHPPSDRLDQTLPSPSARTTLARWPTDDTSIRARITDLVEEERELRAKLGRREITADEEHARLRDVEAELDQCWDLLRQRDARREYGENPDDASGSSERSRREVPRLNVDR